MTSLRFDAALRALAETRSRRQTLTALASGLPSLLVAAGPGDAIARKKGKNQKKCKKCGPCRKCQNGKCKPKRAGAPCGQGKQCAANGKCEACDVCAAGCEFTSVQAAIDAAEPGDTIRICPGTFAGPVVIEEKDLTVIGAGDGDGGTTLTGLRDDSTIRVTQATVELKGMRITGTDGSNSAVNNNSGALTVTDCTISGTKGALHGGGIFNEGNEERGKLTLNNCTVADNQAGSGGGIVNSGGTTILNNCTVRDNAANEEGGGIAVFNGTLTLNNSRVEGNTAGIAGGGLFFLGTTIKDLTLNESTVRGNTPDNFDERL